MIVDIPYGEGSLIAEVPTGTRVIQPPWVFPTASPSQLIQEALMMPIATKSLRQIVKEKKPSGRGSIVIVVNDLTRPTPTAAMLEGLWKEMKMAGVKEEMVTVVIATGDHKPPDNAEQEKIVGSTFKKLFHIESHNCRDEESLSYIGTTDGGLPVTINRYVADAEIKILTGVISSHHAAGFSGGRKSIVPGVAGLKTIKKHHSFPITSYEPVMGELVGNSFHREALAAAEMVGVDFIINAVKNHQHEPLKVFAGALNAAHLEGVRYCQKVWGMDLTVKEGTVIVSPGGYPRDIDLHQAQKAISLAEKVLERPGVIILVAECRLGSGTDFVNLLRDSPDPQAVIEHYRREGYGEAQELKAFLFARTLIKHSIILVSESFPRKKLEELFLLGAESVEEGLEISRQILGKEGEITVIPHASDILL